jgi:uncharacterized membrane protein
MKEWIFARMKEPSTWRGIVGIITAFGIALKPEQIESIVTVGLMLSGLIGVTTTDKQ